MLKSFSKPIYVTRPLLPDLVEFKQKLQKIWDAKWLTNIGDDHRLLEKELCDHLQVLYLSLMNNGTVALMIALKVLGLKGEVITTPFTFPATVHVLEWLGIKPVFCDVDPVTLNIDSRKIEGLITDKTTGILGVHVFGTPCDVFGIEKIAKKHNLKVVYDAAHAFGVEIDGKAIGNFGDLTMFSFHATKLFHTAEGGSLACKDEELKKRIDLMKNFGIKNEEEVVLSGINGKMNEMQAVLGLCVLDLVEEERGKRELLENTYRNCLKAVDGVVLLSEIDNVKKSYQYFVVRIDKDRFGKSRDYVYEKLKEYNVFGRKYFYPLCSNYPCYKDLESADSSRLPVANKVVDEVLCLPLYGELSVNDVENICNILKSFKSV